ncbi:hypothetical protein [Nocardioides conyzicola]|uniref:Uncharacterized protein n=1 Tax=Nocardioides conyzicola TaxID=1651781 RepID=A0ABP8XHT2_9ACTN
MPTNSAPRTGNRVAVVLSAAALITSVGLAGGPAIAKALNADTVDHKHAVGSAASIKARKGKLVATSKRTGRLPSNIVGTVAKAARATDADRLAGSPAAAYLTKAEANQVVGLGGSATLPAAGVTTSAATFTTTKAGRLLVDFTGSGQLQCPSSSFVRWWIAVDGTPVVSSSMQLGEAVSISFDYAGFPAIHLAGITDGPVPAGDHTVNLSGGCTSGASGGSATSGTPGVGSVTVLDDSATVPAAARKGTARKSCVSGGGCR